MNPELQAKIDDIKNLPTHKGVEKMILDAIEKFEGEGETSALEEQQLNTIFTQYNSLKVTESKEIEEVLISYLTTLGIQRIHDEVSEEFSGNSNSGDTIPARMEDVIYTPSTLSLTKEEVLKGFPGLKELPVFSSYQDFLESDFFATAYDLGDTIIKFNKDTWEKDILLLERDSRIKKVQSMLIFLGHMTEEDLLGKYSDTEGESQEFSYYGVGGPKTFGSVAKFQKSVGLNPDEWVGPDTKHRLYTEIYEIFHSSQSTKTLMAYIRK